MRSSMHAAQHSMYTPEGHAWEHKFTQHTLLSAYSGCLGEFGASIRSKVIMKAGLHPHNSAQEWLACSMRCHQRNTYYIDIYVNSDKTQTLSRAESQNSST